MDFTEMDEDAAIEDARRDAIIAEAATWFDQHWPVDSTGGNWWDLLNLGSFDLSSSCRCVCGQLGEILLQSEGLGLFNETLKWQSTGFSLMWIHHEEESREQIDELESSRIMSSAQAQRQRAIVEWEAERVAVLRKRLESESGETLPDHLRLAFIEMRFGDNARWVKQITRRREGGAPGCAT